MYQKFVVFINRKFEPVIVLDNVYYHKAIKFPESFGEPAARCGGGWWKIKDGVLKLSRTSEDLGKYDLETAKEAFEKHNVFYKDKNVFNEFCLSEIDCL